MWEGAGGGGDEAALAMERVCDVMNLDRNAAGIITLTLTIVHCMYVVATEENASYRWSG